MAWKLLLAASNKHLIARLSLLLPLYFPFPSAAAFQTVKCSPRGKKMTI
jgi:hypothetical protein